MALRVKNVAAGFYDATGFHPIRRSADYDSDRAGEDFKDKTAGKGLSYKGSKNKPKSKKRKAVKRATKKTTKRKAAPKRKAVKRTTRKAATKGKRKNPAKATKGMVPAKWTRAKVRRTASGDIQVMFTRK